MTAEAEDVSIAVPLVAGTYPWGSRRILQNVWSSAPAGPLFVARLSPPGLRLDSSGGLFQCLLPRTKTEKTETGLILTALHSSLRIYQKATLSNVTGHMPSYCILRFVTCVSDFKMCCTEATKFCWAAMQLSCLLDTLN